MHIDDIDALLATVQFSSPNQTAEHLGITRSTIVRRLQRLEQELNVILLECRTRPLTLTAAGYRVYEQRLGIKRRTKRLYSLLDPQSEPCGVLRLGVLQSLGEIILPAALSALNQQFPGLPPQITCGWSGQLQRWLEDGELDGTLAMGPTQQSFAEGYSGHLLCPLGVVPIIGRRLNLRAPSLQECAEQGWILNPDGCSLRAGLTRKLQSQGLRLKLSTESTGAQLQIALAVQRLGSGPVPRAAPANSLWWDEITVLNLSDFQPAASLRLIYVQYLINLRLPLTFFISKVVQQLAVSN